MRNLFLGLALLLMVSAPAFAADTVLRVVVVETNDPAGYVQQIERGKAIMQKANSPGQIRVWRANFAGEDTGAIVVSVEYPSLQAFAADTAKLSGNAEFQSWLKGLDAIRKIVSDSLYNEL